MKILWVLVNCNNFKEADNIGRAALKVRLISCYDIFPRAKAAYFWPPRSGKIESAKGVMLVLETLQKNFGKIYKAVLKLHSDKLPFIGSLEIGNVSTAYYKWLKGEIK